MPSWGSDNPDDDWATWQLVLFIRHLPKITKAELREMKAINPKSRSELEEEEETKKFLREGHHH
jgi:hypothetical protein